MADQTATTQEMYCSECKVYFLVTLFTSQNGYEADIVCPGCGHQHRRCVRNGIIEEKGRYNQSGYGDKVERILSTKSSISTNPRTSRMKTAHAAQSFQGRRDGVQIHNEEMESFLQHRWLEHAREENEGERWDDDPRRC